MLAYLESILVLISSLPAVHVVSGEWNSSEDHSALIGTVRASVVGTDRSLYVGGGFIADDGIRKVARWNAQNNQWEALGTGFSGTVFALATDSSGNLYAGGFFTTADGQPANRVARWDGSQTIRSTT